MFLGGLLLAMGWLSGLDWLGLPARALLPALALLILAYMIVAKWLTDSGRRKAEAMEPLIVAALWLAVIAIIWSLLNTTSYWRNDPALLWVALTGALLAASFLLHAWQTNLTGWGHLGIWALVMGGGLVIKSFSHGSGRSAPLAALLAIGLVLAERTLHHHVLSPNAVLWRRAWRLYKRPLLTAAWAVSAGTIGLALLRNLVWLGGGLARQSWSILALSLITGLYALGTYLYKKERFVWLASILAIAPWTLLANLRWYMGGRLAWEWYGGQWVLLGIVLLVAAVAVGKLAIVNGQLSIINRQLPITNYQLPPMIVAHILVPLALVWGLAHADASSVALGLGVLFYGTAVWLDYHFRAKGSLADNRFLFPATILLVGWAVYTLFWLVPQPAITTVALLVLAFSLPLLLVGRRLRSWQPTYQWPLYIVAYGTAVCATVLLLGERPFLIAVLLFNTSLAILSTYLFRKPIWLAVATVLFPWAAWLMLEQAGVERVHIYGWLLTGIGAFYLLWAWVLRTVKLDAYSQPVLAAMFGLVGLGIFLSGSGNDVGALVGFGLAAVVWGLTAVWLRQPILMTAVALLMAGTYGYGLELLSLNLSYWWSLAPGIGLFMLIGYFLDGLWGVEPKTGQPKQLQPFPWYRPWRWPEAAWAAFSRWWALPFHVIALATTCATPFLMLFSHTFSNYSAEAWHFVIALGLGTVVFTYYLFHFRLRGLLLIAWAWLQFTYAAILFWLWPKPDSAAMVALAFMPMTMATAALGLLVQHLRREPAPFTTFNAWWFGWSRPFFAILTVNLALSQLFTVENDGYSIIVTLLNALIISSLATLWRTGWLLYVPLALGWLASWQYLDWLNLPRLSQPTAYAVVTALYGITGYAVLYWQRSESFPPSSQPSPSEGEGADSLPLAGEGLGWGPNRHLQPTNSFTLWQRPLRP